jgi:hypothetical protein
MITVTRRGTAMVGAAVFALSGLGVSGPVEATGAQALPWSRSRTASVRRCRG